MYFKENLKFLRKLNKITQNDLAIHLNYKSFTTIQKWEDGSSIPNVAILKKIANYFNVDLDMLINYDLKLNHSTLSKVGVIGTISCGQPIDAFENISDYEYVSDQDINGIYFYLNVVGDSMIDVRIHDGDIVYCRKQDSVLNGEIGVVLIDQQATLKRVYFKNNQLILKPENQKYDNMIFSIQDIEERQIKILGKLLHNKIRF